jgi:hypothetical protein
MFNHPKQRYSITTTDKNKQSDAVFSVDIYGYSSIYQQDLNKKKNVDGFEFSNDHEKVNIRVHLNSDNFSDVNAAFRFAISKACANRLIYSKDLDQIKQQYTSFHEKNGLEGERRSTVALGYERQAGNAY